MSMRTILSEFMGCKDWENDELCKLVDSLSDRITKRDELISDMWPFILRSDISHGELDELEDKLFELGIEVE